MNDIVNLEGTSLAEQKEYNNKLFQLFGNMVKPLGDLEHLYMLRRNVQSEVKKLEESNIKGKILVIIIIAAIFIANKIGTVMYNIPGLCIIMEHDLLAVIYFVAVTGGAVFLSYTLDKKNRQKKTDSKQADLDNLNTQIEQSIHDMHDKLQFIPPSYCHSDAMRYFAKAYIDGKVDNVKEAMCSYDEYVHRQNMENAQHAILQQQGQIIANQVAISQQISYDSAMIMLSNFAFR